MQLFYIPQIVQVNRQVQKYVYMYSQSTSFEAMDLALYTCSLIIDVLLLESYSMHQYHI